MKKLNYSTTIAIDAERSLLHFYSMIGNDHSTIKHRKKSFAGGLFDEEFFNKFKEAVKEYAQKNPSEKVRKVTVILPDCAVVTDTVRIPTMKGWGQTHKALETTLGGLYRNYDDLHIISYVAQQNKLYTTFAIAAIKKNIVSSIYAACSENKLFVETLTYASCAAVNGAVLADPKLKNASYLFLDVKDVYSRFVFVANGNTMGYYTLPFGLELLKKPKVVGEDMLFDHSYAELTVLNAGERAKSKKLTVLSTADESEFASDEEKPVISPELDGLAEDDGEAFEDTVEEDGVEALEESAEEAVEETVEENAEDEENFEVDPIEIVRPKFNQKIFKKTPRKLPTFMQRPIPETEEGIREENFRVFVKWALTLISGNERLVEIGKPQFVCVNIPSDLADVLDRANEESEENGISFVSLPRADENETFANLELYGGLYSDKIPPVSKF